MNTLPILKAAEEAWIAESDEADFFFELFTEPKSLRRSKLVNGALAALRFGGYFDFGNKWVGHERAVWLEMIVSDLPGAGGTLIDKLKVCLARRRLVLLGTPTPLKPRDWDASRHFVRRENDLIAWYMKHDFRIVQSASETRVIHAPFSTMLETQFSLP